MAWASTSGSASTCAICRSVERFARKHTPDAVDAGVFEALLFGHRKHLLALGVGEEFPVGVEQLQGVPLTGLCDAVMMMPPSALLGDDGHLGARRGAQPDVYHVGTAGQQGAFDQVGDHLARNPGVAADDYGKFLPGFRWATRRAYAVVNFTTSGASGSRPAPRPPCRGYRKWI